MKSVEILAAPARLEDLIELARKESSIILTDSGEPVAQVIPFSKNRGQRVAPLHPGAWEVAADFDEPLPDEFWLGRG